MEEEIQEHKAVENIRDKLFSQINKLIQEAEAELKAINMKEEKGDELGINEGDKLFLHGI